VALRIIRSGRVAPPAAGLAAFTPEGERSWVGAAWDPVYPSGENTLAPGLVFLAAGATWVVTDVDPDRVRYVRVTPGRRAGIVEVRQRDERSVEVTYDLTALDADAETELQAFADAFETMLAQWSARWRRQTEQRDRRWQVGPAAPSSSGTWRTTPSGSPR
jgi:hypothetical protein